MIFRIAVLLVALLAPAHATIGDAWHVAQVVTAPAPTTAAPVTVTTTGPVETKISVGTLASDLLTWVVLAFSGPIGGIVVWILVRVLKKLGIEATDALRVRLQELVVNGLNIGAREVERRLAGRGQVEIKNAVVEDAIAYAQTHGADTIKALGLDPHSGAAVEAIKARIETAIADPFQPTPAVLAPVPDPTAAKV